MRVLIIAEEKLFTKGIHRFLRNEGFSCKEAYTGKDALELIFLQKFDLILLDLKLPDLDGLEVMKRAHILHNNLPVILISVKSSPEDRIVGLNLGADDYLSKPFSFLELKSRILAIIRRKNNLTGNRIDLENIQIDLDSRQVRCNQQILRLTRKEYDILVFLTLNKNRVISRIQLSENVWGDSLEEDNNSNFIDVHIKNLRKKLAPFIKGEFLETIRGIGFRVRELQPL